MFEDFLQLKTLGTVCKDLIAPYHITVHIMAAGPLPHAPSRIQTWVGTGWLSLKIAKLTT